MDAYASNARVPTADGTRSGDSMKPLSMKAASRSVIHMGTAVQRAALDASRRAIQAAAPILGCPPEALKKLGVSYEG